ncbi:ribonuclease Y [Streptomyces sp. SCUT-3]|uniref:ribonuclease Y n=1 Tax=Streptomyces sp. SCUT-3 TaxID=2684469 RepID=UPI0015FA3E49|nr:ribonuclease Y [Streptomyces sp. SCUT-3]QMV21479.1 ribonuclease Y [Streptomyces sp. SCUT-3]
MGVALVGSFPLPAGSAVAVAVALAVLAAGTAAQLRRLRRVREEVRSAAEAEAAGVRAAAREEARELRADLERREQRLADREARLDAETEELRARSLRLAEELGALDRRRAELAEAEADRRRILERTAAMTVREARAEIVRAAEDRAVLEAAATVREIEEEARREGEARARRILAGVLQRIAGERTTEAVVSVLPLPGDDMKARIIGREGRNIRSFESVTGVDLLVDDTPGAVLLSCFDPVRRETARLALEALVADGRINPPRIEEAYERSRAEVERRCLRAGEDAVTDAGITDMHPELVALLGRLRYRTSYGQNVLAHLVESGRLAAMLASELGADPQLARRGALLHDVGKALTRRAEGSHAAVGAEAARRFGESEKVVHAIAAHHDEIEPRTVEAVLVQVADAVSGGRPGARRESLETYVRRLQGLERIAASYEGVEKAYAVQAGREVRVMVRPEAVDDLRARAIARDMARRVQEELAGPGRVRITVVRESRVTETTR